MNTLFISYSEPKLASDILCFIGPRVLIVQINPAQRWMIDDVRLMSCALVYFTQIFKLYAHFYNELSKLKIMYYSWIKSRSKLVKALVMLGQCQYQYVSNFNSTTIVTFGQREARPTVACKLRPSFWSSRLGRGEVMNVFTKLSKIFVEFGKATSVTFE